MNPVNLCVPSVTQGVRAVYDFYRSDYYNALQLGGTGCLGVKELYVDGISKYNHSQQSHQTKPQLHILRGTISVGAGICGIMAALYHMNVVLLKLAPSFLLQMGNALFAIANGVSLYANICKYFKAKQLLRDEEKTAYHCRLMQRSAIFGSISSFGYVLMEILSVLGACSFFTVSIAVIAATMTGAQWMVDYLASMQKKEKVESSPELNTTALPMLPQSQDQQRIENQIRYFQLTTTKA